ncbi:MAG: homoserine dehydrogenase [Acidobacteria bacterium]|nr:homoserine dehydrogenase [Acidobacteriota bacterium]
MPRVDPAGAGSVDLALIGFGRVARRFVRLLNERADRLGRDLGVIPRIVAIATRRHGAALDPAGIDPARALALAEGGHSLAALHGAGTVPANGIELIARLRRDLPDTPSPLVIIETTVLDVEHGQPAIDHVRAAIAAGAHVVTANKGPAAIAYHELRALAEAADISFLFEGAVMDGIPIFNLVRETLPGVEILGFRGVVNSTTNHILTELEVGRAFNDALAEMQALGIAEADASLDIDGWDAAAKAAALANVLMGARLTPRDVDRTGIGAPSGPAARAAVARGNRMRLVASAERRDDGVAARVAPVELPASDLLAGLRGMANALVLRTDLLGEVAITQLEGGLTQTAYALLSDLLAVVARRGPRAAPPDRSL